MKEPTRSFQQGLRDNIVAEDIELQGKEELASGNLQKRINEALAGEDWDGLTPLRQQILIHKMAGLNQVAIVKLLGIHPGTITTANQDPRFSRLYNKVNGVRFGNTAVNYGKVAAAADRHSIRAMEVMAELMDGVDGKGNKIDVPTTVKFNAAKEITHQAGHKPRERIEVEDSGIKEIRMVSTGYDPSNDPFRKYEKEMAGKNEAAEQEALDEKLFTERQESLKNESE